MKFIILILTCMCLSQAVLGQNSGSSGERLERETVAPGPNPQQRGEALSEPAQQKLVDALFVKLREATSEAEAEAIDDALTAFWVRRGGATAQTLIEWSQDEFAHKRFGAALDYLDACLVLNPDHFEAYFRRAVVYVQQRELGKAIVDFTRVLSLEPRHYGALSHLGSIFNETGHKKEALAAFKAALALMPQRTALKRQVERLTPEVEGRPG